MAWSMNHFKVFPISYGNFVSFFICNCGLDSRCTVSEEHGYTKVFIVYAFHVGFVHSYFCTALFCNYCCCSCMVVMLSLIHISEPTRRTPISYAVFCLKKKNKNDNSK